MTVGKPFQPHEKIRFGNVRKGHYTEFDRDNGHMRMFNDATVYLDEFGSLLGQKLESPASHIVQDSAEGTVVFKTSCVYASDWVIINYQFNHDKMAGSAVKPHIHWFQASATMPNWLIRYRWQINGQAKTTAWTDQKYVSNAFTYSAGTLVQITGFGEIAVPATESVSSILQIRVTRDTANTSTLFSGADALGADVHALFYDVHKIVDSVGSDGEYSK